MRLNIYHFIGPCFLRRRRFIRGTYSWCGLAVYLNLAAEFTSDLDQSTLSGRHHLHPTAVRVSLPSYILDAFSRRCMGWAIGHYLEAELAVEPLRLALAIPQIELRLVHHSDKGVQYAASAYTELLKRQGIRISLSHRDNAYD